MKSVSKVIEIGSRLSMESAQHWNGIVGSEGVPIMHVS